MDDDLLAQRIVAITQLAEQLDRGTLDLAVKTVPVAWWEARLGTTAHVGDAPPATPTVAGRSAPRREERRPLSAFPRFPKAVRAR